MEKDASADGLRGLAAVSVVVSHSILAFFPAAFTHYFAWVAGPDAIYGRVESFLATPGLSVLWSGSFSVSVFFVLSGYVLTKSLVEKQDLAIARSLAARRYFRLAGPVLGSALFAFSLMSLGLYYSVDVAAMTSSAWLKGMWNVTPNFFQAVREGLFGAIFRGEVSYNPVFWTMRIEFIGSLLVLAYRCLTLSRRSQIVGATIYIILTASIAPGEWVAYLAFLLGTHLNDVPAPKRRGVLCLLAVIGLYLGGIDGSGLYGWLGYIPVDAPTRSGVFGVFGAAILVYAVKAGAFSGLLRSGPVQFLGRISYSLYLVHLPIILSVACGSYLWLVVNQGFGRVAAAALSFALAFPTTIAVAMAFTRLVDEPCIKLSRRLFPSGKATVVPRSENTTKNLARSA
ncbi:acyltransferase family protein [Achromobacter deleyi]|uniref:acyltransferase family protein n=1 Tax=Achromobacter deleyi TaxID=1353891 RepID=UPI001491B545|nr:acyltransferase [Achromobacter deleyi]QVQ29156.1 acyltransferase [Achromobacter deleyi]UIP19275.1 acyltransferase [Achromobacter deleyi]